MTARPLHSWRYRRSPASVENPELYEIPSLFCHCFSPSDDELLGQTSGEVMSLAENFRAQAVELVELLDETIPAVARLKQLLAKLPSQHLADVCAAVVKASYTERLQVLDAVELGDRFRATLPLLMRQIEVRDNGYAV